MPPACSLSLLTGFPLFLTLLPWAGERKRTEHKRGKRLEKDAEKERVELNCNKRKISAACMRGTRSRCKGWRRDY
ncbi:hypothetical protein V8C34DRAFT_296091 [Trichoderma compactum]